MYSSIKSRIYKKNNESKKPSTFNPKEILPGPEIKSESALSMPRENGTTIFHPVGTCKMGQDNMAVVNDRLQVHRVKKLRVVDASIMPRITSGNTQP